MTRYCTLLIVLTLMAGQAFAAGVSSPLGRTVEDFTLKDFRGKAHSLHDFGESRAIVVAYMGTECPLAKLYAPRLASLAEKYDKKGVAFIVVNSNRQDSNTELAAYARIYGLTFPVLKDLGNQVADQMGAVRTPEVFLLDSERVVRYWGRIDDQYGINYAREAPKRADLELAVTQLLAGEPVEVSETASVGCHIGRVRDVKPHSPITYSNQIARLLQKRCVECHREGEIAPFALTQYDEVAGWAEMMAEVVRERRMPPWHANPEHGDFSNDRRMTDEDREMIYQWAAAGAPEGDPSELPEPLTFTEGWQLTHEPDVIIPMRDEPFTVPAEGAVKYQYFNVDPGFTEDTWIKEVELLPGNRAVVHHILLFIRPPGAKRRRGLEEGFLGAYVPGLRAVRLPEGMAKLVPAGSQLVFQVHYTPNGTEQTDMSRLGLILADTKKVTHAVQSIEAINGEFKIPPHAGNHEVQATSFDYAKDLTLLSLSPHMHLRGKSFRYEARYPDGTSEVLLDVPHYDFNWQTMYRLTKFKPLPKGTRMYCVAHFDNSEENLNNPDPEDTVRWGDQTWQEMMIGFYDVAFAVTQEEIAQGKVGLLKPTSNAIAERLISRFDKNDDGKVERSEVSLKAQLFFLRFDKNVDGVLTVDEVAEVIQKRLDEE